MRINVKQSKKKYTTTEILVFCAYLLLIIILATNPAKYSTVALKGLEVWAKILLPAMFPFFVLTKLFSSSGLIFDITKVLSPVTKKIYKSPPITSYVFIMSVITGYPVGSKLIADLYYENKLSKNDAIKALSFCANSGPMFILGSVAIGMFLSPKMGIIIYVSHIIGALLNGLIYRNIKSSDNSQDFDYEVKKITFSDSIMQSISSIMLIGGVVCFTFVLIEIITSSILFSKFVLFFEHLGVDGQIFTAILSGIFEITKGCLMLAECNLSFFSSTLYCTFIISFGGIATFLQAIAFTKDFVKPKTFLLQKLTHAICATIICFFILLFF